MRRCLIAIVFVAASGFSTGRVDASRAEQTTRQQHIAWVADALKRMRTVTVGMTRTDLLKAFTTEGGLSSRQQRVYVSQDCPYFKVGVQFRPVGPTDMSSATEGSRDVIVSISKPYLEFTVMD